MNLDRPQPGAHCKHGGRRGVVDSTWFGRVYDDKPGQREEFHVVGKYQDGEHFVCPVSELEIVSQETLGGGDHVCTTGVAA